VLRPQRIGIQLPEVEREVRWAEVASMARAAEESGFDSIWLGDHLLYRDDGRRERGPWDVWTQLAALAAVTERVALGPLVACTAFHPPGLLARMAASVDEVSGGRLVLGIGAGWNDPEFRAFGIPYDHRVSRFEEAFAIIRRLLAGERVTLSGRFYAAEDAVLLPPPVRPVPLMIGAHGARMLSIALPHVGAWNTWYEQYGNDPARFADVNARVDAAAADAERDPREIERSACLLVAVEPAPEERARDPKAPPVAVDALADAVHDLGEAGADEVILVAMPIDETSIRTLAAALGRPAPI
jgi:alkanesulfonate monooxygenase SsuD/methylene tetrahydromethanopterin reductase-like flavin-dependent oxidoreductase (luciferase family)